MKFIWSTRAKSSYLKIREQIRENFTTKEEAEFVVEVFYTLDAIHKFPKAFPESDRLKGVRKAVVHPHTCIFYRLEKKHIRLLLFWDNRNNPKNI